MSITQPECLCVCVCSLRYPACNAHAPYYNLWRARLYNTLPYFVINGMIFEKKKLLNMKCVSSFSTDLSETFFILRVIERDVIENVCWSAYRMPFVLVLF